MFSNQFKQAGRNQISIKHRCHVRTKITTPSKMYLRCLMSSTSQHTISYLIPYIYIISSYFFEYCTNEIINCKIMNMFPFMFLLMLFLILFYVYYILYVVLNNSTYVYYVCVCLALFSSGQGQV